MKNKTYIGIMCGNNIRYVTHVDLRTKTALWQEEKPAYAMGKTNAENLYFGLRCNGYRAVIITMPEYEEPVNGGADA